MMTCDGSTKIVNFMNPRAGVLLFVWSSILEIFFNSYKDVIITDGGLQIIIGTQMHGHWAVKGL